MVVGNTGVGKSSLGNRLLGFLPQDSQKPFVVAASGDTVTQRVQQYAGTWFGETPGSKLVVVDTPGLLLCTTVQLYFGEVSVVERTDSLRVRSATRALKLCSAAGLGDPGSPPDRPGPLVDTENMAAAGRYLDDNPVNAIVIVLGAINPRVDFTLARLIQIIVGKLHARDYNKILVAVNAYGHDPHTVSARVATDEACLTEEQIQEYVKNEVLKSFESRSHFAITFAPYCCNA